VIESPSAATTMGPSAAAWIGLLCDLRRNSLVLPHDVVALQSGDDALDVRMLVTGMDGELMCLRADLLVFGRRHADALNAAGVAAFANKVERLRLEVERLGETLNPLVDLPKDGFVQPDALFA
jgi:hypothetical protein